MGFKSVIYNVYYLTHASLMDHETRGLASEVARRSPEPKVVLRRYYACASNCTVPRNKPRIYTLNVLLLTKEHYQRKIRTVIFT